MAKTFMEMVGEAKAEVAGMSIEQVLAAKQDNPDMLMIDVRDAGDIAGTGIVPGAVAISLGTLGFKGDVTLPKEMQHLELGNHDQQIVVTCTRGAMASLGAKLLKDLGYNNVTFMDGGTNAWKEAEQPVDEFVV